MHVPDAIFSYRISFSCYVFNAYYYTVKISEVGIGDFWIYSHYSIFGNWIINQRFQAWFTLLVSNGMASCSSTYIICVKMVVFLRCPQVAWHFQTPTIRSLAVKQWGWLWNIKKLKNAKRQMQKSAQPRCHKATCFFVFSSSFFFIKKVKTWESTKPFEIWQYQTPASKRHSSDAYPE